MNLFQWITLPLLGLFILNELWQMWRRISSWRIRAFRALVWAGAFIAIANPGIPQFLANKVGIDRGTDLAFYLFALAFLMVSFYFYTRYQRLQRQLTDLVRTIALEQAHKPPADPMA